MDRNDFWDSSKAFSKPMDTPLMTRLAGQTWYMPLVGPMLEDSFSRRAAKSTRPGCNFDCGADGRTVCRRCGSSAQSAEYCGAPYPAKPLLGDIRSKIEAAQSVALPSSALSKACQSALTLWTKLTRFLEYPELELSNNLAENSMRPVALGVRTGYTSEAHR